MEVSPAQAEKREQGGPVRISQAAGLQSYSRTIGQLLPSQRCI